MLFCLVIAFQSNGIQRAVKAGETLDQKKNLGASEVVELLMRSGTCKQLPDLGNWAGTEYGNLIQKDLVASCLSYSGSKPKAVECDSTIFVSVGSEAGNPKRPLIYEDGMSVGLVYGKNWQIEISPVFGAQDPIKTTLRFCRGKVKRLQSWLGGQVTAYGQYK